MNAGVTSGNPIPIQLGTDRGFHAGSHPFPAVSLRLWNNSSAENYAVSGGGGFIRLRPDRKF